MNLIRGQKLKMSQLFDEKGNVIPVTLIKLGDKEDSSLFQEGDKVKISGTSKGKGFAGAVKKWGFSGRDATHGVKHEHRTLGSVGSSFPERVFKGKKMPGRMGAERVTVKNLKIVKIDKERKLLTIKGAVPGHRGTLLEIRS
jgi:large subunit ribosomal protein L3